MFSKSLTLQGTVGGTTLSPTLDTGTSGDARGWFLMGFGRDTTLEGLDFNGSGFLVHTAIRNHGTLTVRNCDFTEIKYNESGPHYVGIAISHFDTSGLGTITDCTFSENSAGEGGGTYNKNSTLDFTRCSFMDNDSEGGGGSYEKSTDTAFYNCLFARNDSLSGAGLFDWGGSQVINCTFAENQADGLGGAIYSLDDTVIRNTVFSDNTDSSGVDSATASIYSPYWDATTSYSIVPGSGGSGTNWVANCGVDGGNNLDVDAKIIGEGNYQLQVISPAINAGTNAYVVGSTDLLGNARIYDTTVDLGCYETSDDGTDSDFDTLTDYEEGVAYGSDPDLADTDFDGIDDGDEVFTGTDLLDSDSVFAATVSEASGSTLTLTWPSANNRYYTLEGCTNLVSDEWFIISGYVETAPQNTAVIDIDGTATFYRLSVAEWIH